MLGQCYCGAVKFELLPPLKFVAHDHCSICRRIHGAAFVTWTGVPDTQFKLISGADKLTQFQSSAKGKREFCKVCGSHLFFRGTSWPGEVHVAVASLTDASEIKAKAHVYYSDKVNWVEINDNLKKFGGKTGFEPLT
jgi:hypothetical protein